MGWLPGFPIFVRCMPSMELTYTQVVSSTEGVPGSVRAKPRGNTQNRYWASVAAAGGLRAARITGSPVSMLRMCRI